MAACLYFYVSMFIIEKLVENNNKYIVQSTSINIFRIGYIRHETTRYKRLDELS